MAEGANTGIARRTLNDILKRLQERGIVDSAGESISRIYRLRDL